MWPLLHPQVRRQQQNVPLRRVVGEAQRRWATPHPAPPQLLLLLLQPIQGQVQHRLLLRQPLVMPYVGCRFG